MFQGVKMKANFPKRAVLAVGVAVSIMAAGTAIAAKQSGQAAAKDDPATPRFRVTDLDTSKRVCDDLSEYVNSKWLAANPIPADRTTWGAFERLAQQSEEATHSIAVKAAANTRATGVEKLVGELFASGMDTQSREAMGAAPLKAAFKSIDALKTPADIARYMAVHNDDGLADAFGAGGGSDFKDATKVIAFAVQGGLSLPERAYYLEDGKDGSYKRIREAFVGHLKNQLVNAGVAPELAAQQAAQTLALETKLAQASLSPIERRDPAKNYNVVSMADAQAANPHLDWANFWKSQGVNVASFSLSQPAFFKALDGLVANEPVAHWQAYFRTHAAMSLAPYLSNTFQDEQFAFFGKTLKGQPEQRDLWKRVLGSVQGSTGEALGQLYVKDYFPASSKKAMEGLVGDLSQALKARINALDWMSPETKKKAMEKWVTFKPMIGYPDKWRSWQGLNFKRNDYVGNIVAARKFNSAYSMAKIGKPSDRNEWGMTPQTVNAYYNASKNVIVFPAAILQPPFFDPNADIAVNYGGIGAVIGHEMLHGYDDKGSQFDANGNFSNWWTESDRKGFTSRTDKLVQQFDDYRSVDNLPVKGQLTLGENIADLGGLNVALDALHSAMKRDGIKPDAKIDGLTYEQRFFMNWATVWRRNHRPEELKVRLNTDSHAPANFRAIGAPSNMPAFAKAFQCKAGDAMVRDDAHRVVIW
jgi:putative endopeptidase